MIDKVISEAYFRINEKQPATVGWKFGANTQINKRGKGSYLGNITRIFISCPKSIVESTAVCWLCDYFFLMEPSFRDIGKTQPTKIPEKEISRKIGI
ncbi:hypothetical protein D9V87_08060 [Bacteroidetes/Chlorobi group bacterium MS-B_bin-24]|nr:MAG: hypothetical protein D9V87_08060 [Bacteroidetes/Chlorobi group bacterium MS-B_bin-24]